MGAFGEFVRQLRLKNSMTLREFCRIAGIDPSNWSKIERGMLQPPKSKTALQKLAKSLNLEEGTNDYETLFELAAIEYVPKELLRNEKVVDQLPVFFRTVRGTKPSREELEELLKILEEE